MQQRLPFQLLFEIIARYLCTPFFKKMIIISFLLVINFYVFANKSQWKFIQCPRLQVLGCTSHVSKTLIQSREMGKWIINQNKQIPWCEISVHNSWVLGWKVRVFKQNYQGIASSFCYPVSLTFFEISWLRFRTFLLPLLSLNSQSLGTHLEQEFSTIY